MLKSSPVGSRNSFSLRHRQATHYHPLVARSLLGKRRRDAHAMSQRLADAAEMMLLSAGTGGRNPSMDTTSTIIAFPDQQQRAARSVLVVRKSVHSPFEGKQVQAALTGCLTLQSIWRSPWLAVANLPTAVTRLP